MDPGPSPNEAPNRARELAPQRSPGAARDTPRPPATAYTPKPDFAAEEPARVKRPGRHRWMIWAASAATAVLLFGGSYALHHQAAMPAAAAENLLVLQAGDIDQAATINARAMLARGEIPAPLVHASDEVRQEVADGRQSLYTKQLLPPEPPKGFAIHVTVSEAGAVLGEDVLTSEHPRTTTFPAGSGAPVHFHFAVESAGPEGSITCWANSTSGASVHTAPMPTGGNGDLEAVSR